MTHRDQARDRVAAAAFGVAHDRVVELLELGVMDGGTFKKIASY